MEVKATSNLDSGTESEVEAAQETLLAARTSIVVAHRLRTARRADRVLAMEGGRVVEDGTLRRSGHPGVPVHRTRPHLGVLRTPAVNPVTPLGRGNENRESRYGRPPRSPAR